MDRDYSDIIDLPHHVSSRHAHLPMESRAAQSSPFAALTGYGDAIDETARLTDERVLLDEDRKAELDERLQLLQDSFLQGTPPQAIRITYFVADARKEGGSYRTSTFRVKKINPTTRTIAMSSGDVIPIDDIYDIQME